MYLQASTSLMESVASRWGGFISPDDVKEEILERNEDVEDLVAEE